MVFPLGFNGRTLAIHVFAVGCPYRFEYEKGGRKCWPHFLCDLTPKNHTLRFVKRDSRNHKKQLRAKYDRLRLQKDAKEAQTRIGIVSPERVARGVTCLDAYNNPRFWTRNQPVHIENKAFLMDPLAIASITKSHRETAKYLREQALITDIIRGNIDIPVFWYENYIFLPTSFHYAGHEIRTDPLVKELAPVLKSSSGRLALLPALENMPTYLVRKLDKARSNGLAVKISIPEGYYSLFYEEFEPYRSQEREYHNVLFIKDRIYF